jgi:hypothetical protein
MQPIYLALGLYVIDRIFELYETKGMSEEEIRSILPAEIETFVKNREQMDGEIAAAESNG